MQGKLQVILFTEKHSAASVSTILTLWSTQGRLLPNHSLVQLFLPRSKLLGGIITNQILKLKEKN